MQSNINFLEKLLYHPNYKANLGKWNIFLTAMFSKKGIVEIGRKKGGSVLTFGLANDKI